ncbi:MAG: oxidoreductase-like domain-containing protein [Ectothiorhodospiraceae bacterium]
MGDERDADGPRLPPKPQPPDPSECCNSGCEPCVFELYEDALERWEARVERIRQRWRERREY